MKNSICETSGCNNNSQGRKFCATCRKRQHRQKDLVKYAYDNLKGSAASRDIFFDLTLDEFKEFCYETEYMTGKGRKIGSFNVDRIVEGKTPGYTKSNIQCLDKLKNIKKYFAYNRITKRYDKIPFPEEQQQIPKEDLPF